YGGGSFHCGVSTERDPAETASGATSPKLGPPRGTDDQAIRCTARRWRQRGCQRLCAPATRAAFRACSRALRVGVAGTSFARTSSHEETQEIRKGVDPWEGRAVSRPEHA